MWKALESLVKAIREEGKPVSLVGHSLGGLLALVVNNDALTQVEKVVTISAPFRGSETATKLKWFYPTYRLFQDIAEGSTFVKRVTSCEPVDNLLSIITTGNSTPFLGEANDTVVTVSSQESLAFGTKIRLNVNHFEVLLSDEALTLVSSHIFPEHQK